MFICRIMFWSTYHRRGFIYQSRMDGSHTETFISNLMFPLGLRIDFQNSRLWWTNDHIDIMSSTLDAADIKTFLRFPRMRGPCQVAFLRGRVFWVHHWTKMLQSSDMLGGGIQTLHTDSGFLQNLIAVPREHLPMNRTNDCENRKCKKVCVLTPDAFSCMN